MHSFFQIFFTLQMRTHNNRIQKNIKKLIKSNRQYTTHTYPNYNCESGHLFSIVIVLLSRRRPSLLLSPLKAHTCSRDKHFDDRFGFCFALNRKKIIVLFNMTSNIKCLYVTKSHLKRN